MIIADRPTTKGPLTVTLASIDIAGATVDATLGQGIIAQNGRVIEIPPALRAKAPREFSHLFYATDGSQAIVALKASEMAPVLAQIAAYASENARVAAMPVHLDRIKAERLFAKAEGLQDEPGRYFPALAKARAALATWQATYPEAAIEERRQELLAAAEAFDHKASGALVYDADGWLSAQEQERRAAEFRTQAQAKRDEAAHL